jgi:hypothetical protein
VTGDTSSGDEISSVFPDFAFLFFSENERQTPSNQ